MKDSLERGGLFVKPLPAQKQEITALEDIPEFDTPEAEACFWKTHQMSQYLLDQVRNIGDSEEERS